MEKIVEELNNAEIIDKTGEKLIKLDNEMESTLELKTLHVHRKKIMLI